MLAVLIVFTPRLIHYFSVPEIILTIEDVERINQQELIPKKALSKTNRRKQKSQSKYRLPPHKFNPNKYTEAEWTYLGLSKKQAAVIMKFIKPGISSNRALEKVYVFPKELMSLIKDSTFYPKAPAMINHSEEKVLALDHVQPRPILELNSIDSVQLVSLRGIGPFYASQILKYRRKIGGFYEFEQLLEVWKMRSEAYKVLTEQLFIDDEKIQKLRLNTISFEELYKHPYLSYAQANSIVKMRMQSDGFKTTSEIKKSKLIDSKTYNKLLPYLIIE